MSDPLLIKSVTGPKKVLLGGRAAYKVKEYNRADTDVTDKEKLTIKWRVELFRAGRWVKSYKILPASMFTIKDDTFIIRKVPQEWRYQEIHVYAFVDKPVSYVVAKTMTKGAWIVNRSWSSQEISDYKKYSQTFAGYYLKSKGERFVCEDFVLTSMLSFAKQRNLPLKIENGTGKYDAKLYDYDHGATKFESFEHRVLITTGAPDLMNFRTNTTIVKNGRVITAGKVDAAAINKVQSGDLFLLEYDSDGQANHVQLVTDIVRVPPGASAAGKAPKASIPIIAIAQGNFPSGATTAARYVLRFYLQGNPNDPDASNYYGVEVQEAVYDFNAQTYTRNGSTSAKPPKQIFFIARWNYNGW